MELDWLKKVRAEPVSVQHEWIGRDGELAVSRQCALAGVVRSWVYAPRAAEPLDEQDRRLLELIDAEYTHRPYYGSRRMVRMAMLARVCHGPNVAPLFSNEIVKVLVAAPA